MTDHAVAGHNYRIGRLNVRQQSEVVTRLGFMAFSLEGDVTEDHVEGARFFAAIATGQWGAIPQADRDVIESTCLSVVQVQRAERFHPAFNVQTGEPNFEDVGIDLSIKYELLDLVIQDNMAPFFEKLREDREKRRLASQNPTEQSTSP